MVSFVSVFLAQPRTGNVIAESIRKSVTKVSSVIDVVWRLHEPKCAANGWLIFDLQPR